MTVGELKKALAAIPDNVDVAGIAYVESPGGWMQNVDTIGLRSVQFYRPDRLVLAFEKIAKMRRHSAMGTLWPAAPAP